MATTGASLWGGSGVAGQYILQDCGFSTGWLVVTRMLLAGIILLAMDAAWHRDGIFVIWRAAKDGWETLIFAIFGMLAVQYSYFACIKEGNAAAATVLQYLMPVVIILYTTIATRHAPRKAEILCVLLAVSGTFLLVTHGSLETLAIPPLAVFWGITSAVAAAIYTVTPKRLIRKWRATLVIGWGMLLGGLVLAFVYPPWEFSGTWNMTTALIYFYIILFGTVIAFACYIGSIKYIQPAETGILGSLEPLSAIVLSVVFLGADFSLLDIFGTALILSTVVLLAKS